MLYVPAWTDDPQFTSVDFKNTQIRWVWKKQKENVRERGKSYKSDLTFKLCCFFLLTWLVVVDISKKENDDAEGDESSPPRQ